MMPMARIAEIAWVTSVFPTEMVMDHEGAKPDDLAAVLACAAYMARETCLAHPATRARVDATIEEALNYAKARNPHHGGGPGI